MIGNIKRSPKFIRAKTEEELQLKILKMQLLTGKEYPFLTIYPVKGGVIAWYYDSSSFNELLRTSNVN